MDRGRIGQMVVVSLLNICSFLAMLIVLLVIFIVYAVIPNQDGTYAVSLYLVLAIMAIMEIYKWIVSFRVVIRGQMKGLLFFVFYGLFIVIIGIVMGYIFHIVVGISYIVAFLLYRNSLQTTQIDE